MARPNDFTELRAEIAQLLRYGLNDRRIGVRFKVAVGVRASSAKSPDVL